MFYSAIDNNNILSTSHHHFCRGTHTGYLPTGPASRTTLSETVFSAITAFENLRVAILIPGPYFEDTFTPILKYLFSSSDTPSPSPNDDSPEAPSPRHTPPTLRELAVNFNCTCEENAPLLTKVTGLSKLSISSPTRAILDLLPDWLRRLSDSLTEFYLKVCSLLSFLCYPPVQFSFFFPPLPSLLRFSPFIRPLLFFSLFVQPHRLTD